jgi:hypothetical protein
MEVGKSEVGVSQKIHYTIKYVKGHKLYQMLIKYVK